MAQNNLYQNVDNSWIYNSQKVETIEMAINRRMDKWLWYIHTME